MCRRTHPQHPAERLHWSSPGSKGERALHFFGGVLQGLLEDLVLERLLAQHSLQLGDLRTRTRQLRRRHHRFAGRGTVIRKDERP